MSLTFSFSSIPCIFIFLRSVVMFVSLGLGVSHGRIYSNNLWDLMIHSHVIIWQLKSKLWVCVCTGLLINRFLFRVKAFCFYVQLPGILQWPWEGLSEPHFALSETRQKGSFVSSISLCGDAHRQLSLTSSFKKNLFIVILIRFFF